MRSPVLSGGSIVDYSERTVKRAATSPSSRLREPCRPGWALDGELGALRVAASHMNGGAVLSSGRNTEHAISPRNARASDCQVAVPHSPFAFAVAFTPLFVIPEYVSPRGCG